jgi:hypothetical protein
MPRNILYVNGLSTSTRSRDLEQGSLFRDCIDVIEFKAFGKIVRCDIPAPQGQPRGFALNIFSSLLGLPSSNSKKNEMLKRPCTK